MADAQPQPIDGVVDEHHTMATHTQQRHRDEDEHTRASFRLPSTITLDPTNYHGWARQMQAMLEYGGMWELVRPLTQGESEAATGAAAQQKVSTSSSSSTMSAGTVRGSNPRRAECYLMLTLACRDAESSRVILTAPQGDPRAVWSALARRYAYMPKAAAAALHGKLLRSRQDNDNARGFADRLTFMRLQLEQNGRMVGDQDMITAFATGVSAPLAAAVNLLLNTRDDATFESLVEAARGEETRLLLASGAAGDKVAHHTPSGAFGVTPSGSHAAQTCHGCGSADHFIAQCPRSSSQQGQQRGVTDRTQRTANAKEIAGGMCPIPGHRTHKAVQCRLGGRLTPAAAASTSSNTEHTQQSDRMVVSLGSARVSTNGPVDMIGALGVGSGGGAPQGSDEIILDSGAGTTVVGAGKPFLNGVPAPDMRITVANGAVLDFPSRGTAVIDGPGSLQLHVKNALQHAQIDRTLLSVSSVLVNTDTVDCIVFRKTGATALTPTGEILFTATQKNGVYVLDTARSDAKDTAATTQHLASAVTLQPPRNTESSSSVPYSLVHARLCHRSDDGIRRLLQAGIVEGLEGVKCPKVNSHDRDRCDGCAKAKAHRNPFSVHMHPTKAPTHLMSCLSADVGGPVSVVSLGGSVYFLVLYVVWAEFVAVSFLATKGQAEERIKDFCRRARTRHGRDFVEFHSDGGGEFVSARLAKFFRLAGTHATLTEPDTPQHNAQPERLMRTLTEWTTAILIHAGAPRKFWALAMSTVVYVRNLTQVCKGDRSTPFARWFDLTSLASVKNTRVWGCDADVLYTQTPGHKLPKLSHKSRLCMFVGYDEDRNYSWRFYDPTKQIVLTSRDATFHESRFTLAHAEMAHEIAADDGAEEESDTNWLTRTTLDNETKLAQIISLEDAERSDRARAIAPSVPSEGANESPQASEDAETDDSEDESEDVDPDVEDAEVPVASRSRSPSPARVAGEQRVDGVLGRPRRDPKPVLRYGMTNGNLAQARAIFIGALGDGDPDSNLKDIKQKLASTLSQTVPRSYVDAMNDPSWQAAIRAELESHRANKSWTYAPLPPGKKALGFMYVFRIKLASDGTIDKRKARLTARGDQWRNTEQIDTFAPVVSYPTLRVFLALVAAEDYELYQLDVETAFLNANVKEEVYMKVPDGVTDAPAGMVCRLLKAVYGIPQAPLAWHDEITSFLATLGYFPSALDPCLLIRTLKNGRKIWFPLFVDDLYPAVHPDDRAEWLADRTKLLARYKIKDSGDAVTILGMRVKRDRTTRTLYLDSQLFTERLCLEYGVNMAGKKIVLSPEVGESTAAASSKIGAQAAENDSAAFDVSFAALVGSFGYLACTTRPDIAHATNTLARVLKDPSPADRTAAWRLLKYLACTASLGLTFSGSLTRRPLIAYSDANWAGHAGENGARSTTGFLVKIGSAPVSWKSKAQEIVAHSSTESEYVAMSHCAREVTWIRGILAECGVSVEGAPTPLRCDNQAAIALAENHRRISQRTKHIQVRFHYIRQCIMDKSIILEWVQTARQPADVFTKALGPQIFTNLRACVQGIEEAM